jgi:hypothetical protein
MFRGINMIKASDQIEEEGRNGKKERKKERKKEK